MLIENSEKPAAKPAPGLDGVIAAETVLSHVDGNAGCLIMRGFELRDLASHSFEQVLALLWQDFATDLPDAAGISAELGKARLPAFAIVRQFLPLVGQLSQAEALRLMLSALGDRISTARHLAAVAAVPVFAAAIARHHQGLPPVAPDAKLGHAADFLHMLHDRPTTPDKIAALNAYLVTVADHGLNASTFTARVIASTKAGLFSAVIGGLCALKGPLHGGAPGPVLDMLDAIGNETNIDVWLRAELARGERLMGFGHRIYRVRDPRADVLKAALGRLHDDHGRILFAEKVERQALGLLAEKSPHRRLETNVEFFTALLLEAVGFPRESFTNVFAAGRMAGWTAHVLEQEQTGRLIRPQSDYIGPMPA